MTLNVTLSHAAGRWHATDRDTGLSASARAPDTAVGRLVFLLMFHTQDAPDSPIGPNLRDALRRVRDQVQEGGGS